MKGHVGDLACWYHHIFSHPFIHVFLQSSQGTEEAVKEQLVELDTCYSDCVCISLVLYLCRESLDCDAH